MKYYKIGEVSKLTGVPPETIRYWEKKGLIKPDRKFGNRRFYTYKTIKKIIEIVESREKVKIKSSKTIKEELKEILKIIKDI
ncbi:MAG: MerR family transcriptional regulator [Candidatus Hydrothermia bacterium]|jgi:DNA-binding transcriptional MerR regulator|nr:MerR family DNA-binding transcriptional regulator [Candidatus Hydrothermia bacterium]